MASDRQLLALLSLALRLSFVTSADFQGVFDCELHMKFRGSKPFDQFQVRSNVDCALKCAGETKCAAFNVGKDIPGDKHLMCELLPRAADHCADLSTAGMWRYFRNVDRTLEGNACMECHSEPSCSSGWTKVFEVKSNGTVLYGNQDCFKEMIARGAQVRVIQNDANTFLSSTPVLYTFSDTNNEMHLQLQSQIKPLGLTNSTQTRASATMISSNGNIYKSNWTLPGAVSSNGTVNSSLIFFVKDNVCDQLVFSFGGPQKFGKHSDLFEHYKKGERFLVHVKDQGVTEVSGTHYLMTNNLQIAFLKYYGLLANSTAPGSFASPLSREIQIVDDQGNSHELQQALLTSSVKDIKKTGLQVDWYADTCWQIAEKENATSGNSSGTSVTDVTEVLKKVYSGHRVRVMYNWQSSNSSTQDPVHLQATYEADFITCDVTNVCHFISVAHVLKQADDPFKILTGNLQMLDQIIESRSDDKGVTLYLLLSYPWPTLYYKNAVAAWFVDTLTWTLVFKSTSSQSSDPALLEQTILNGTSLRLQVTESIDIRYFEVQTATVQQNTATGGIILETTPVMIPHVGDASCPNEGVWFRYEFIIPNLLLRYSWNYNRTLACERGNYVNYVSVSVFSEG